MPFKAGIYLAMTTYISHVHIARVTLTLHKRIDKEVVTNICTYFGWVIVIWNQTIYVPAFAYSTLSLRLDKHHCGIQGDFIGKDC